MRIFLLVAAGWALAPWGLVQAEGVWRLESSESLPTRSPAVTHRLLAFQNDREWHLVRFDRSRATLRVLDLAPGETVAAAVRASGGLAGVNGGYFKPDRVPLGLVVSKGVALHPWESSKILTGALVVTARGASLVRNAEFKPGPDLRDALQAGPFLVDHGKPVPGLNSTHRAERTVLLADGKGVVALLTTAPVSLAELGRCLATPGLLPGTKIERALNLDGGSSTALWVAADPSPYSRPEWKAVRNAVAILGK
ncbi:MAG: phosphodiester glycosidase family protein [Verrucomicrobia bacterium]|nr:phosphodiester glycosidase family protein [Verrucomicrobiota bacterium]